MDPISTSIGIVVFDVLTKVRIISMLFTLTPGPLASSRVSCYVYSLHHDGERTESPFQVRIPWLVLEGGPSSLALQKLWESVHWKPALLWLLVCVLELKLWRIPYLKCWSNSTPKTAVLNLWGQTPPRVEWPHRSRPSLSENKFIFIMIYNNSKIIIMKFQNKQFYASGSLQHEEHEEVLLC